jgi:hypothetical protein
MQLLNMERAMRIQIDKKLTSLSLSVFFARAYGSTRETEQEHKRNTNIKNFLRRKSEMSTNNHQKNTKKKKEAERCPN